MLVLFTFMVTEMTVCEFLREITGDLKNLTPVENHLWQNAKIERSENRSQDDRIESARF